MFSRPEKSAIAINYGLCPHVACQAYRDGEGQRRNAVVLGGSHSIIPHYLDVTWRAFSPCRNIPLKAGAKNGDPKLISIGIQYAEFISYLGA
jgi:hypothetical protein